MSVRVTEPTPAFTGDGSRRRSIRLTVGEVAYQLEVVWTGSRYEFTEQWFKGETHHKGDRMKPFPSRTTIPPQGNWSGVIQQTSMWAADRTRDLL